MEGGGRFPKREHLVSRRLMEQLFGSGSQSMVAYPLRVVFLKVERPAVGVPVQILISVSKRHFKHAVDRNRIKRQVREAYRRLKQPLCDAVPADQSLLVSFVWLSDQLAPTSVVYARLQKLLARVTEKIGQQP